MKILELSYTDVLKAMKLASQSNADTGVADMFQTKSTTKSHRSEQANEMLHILNDMLFFCLYAKRTASLRSLFLPKNTVTSNSQRTNSKEFH